LSKEAILKVMVLGSGAREHALLWKYSRSNRISGLFAAPGNAGTASLATNVPDVDVSDATSVLAGAKEHKVDLVFVGPEAALVAGAVDALDAAGIPAIGPSSAAAQLEGSKEYSKEFMGRHAIPTAAYMSFGDPVEAERYIESTGERIVVKKSGLAAGKGVLESQDRGQLISFATSVLAEGDSVVVEQHLSGYEVSVFVLCDGSNYLALPPCTDYKKAGVGGTGPNTGGMGAICPVPWLPPEVQQAIQGQIVEPTFRGLRAEGQAYRGVVYFGIMVTDAGPMLLEYNVRFGDPEAQVVLPLIQNDFADLSEAIVQGELDRVDLRVSDQSALGVVIAAPGYPFSYPRRLPIDPLPTPNTKDAVVFHASTAEEAGQLSTGGGRCFTVVGFGNELLQARANAYKTAKEVTFPGSWMRPDIGGRIFGK